MSKTRISIELIDADRCAYGEDYFTRLVFICSYYSDFLSTYGKKETLSLDEKILVQETIKKMIAEQNQIDCISDEEFYRCGENIKKIMEEQRTSCSGYNFVDLHTGYILKLDPLLLDAVFIAANKQLIDSICMRQEEFDELILMLGSARQTWTIDHINRLANGTGSIFYDLCLLEHHLKQKMPNKKILLKKLTLPDVFQDLTEGTNYNYILAKLKGLENRLDEARHEKYVHDDAKFLIVYMAAHSVFKQYFQPNQPNNQAAHSVTLNFYDDCDDILGSVAKICREFPQVLPRQLILKLHSYVGRFISIDTIVGEGPIDYCFHNNLSLIARMCGCKLSYRDINAARELKVDKFLEHRLIDIDALPYLKYPECLLFSKIQKNQTEEELTTENYYLSKIK